MRLIVRLSLIATLSLCVSCAGSRVLVTAPTVGCSSLVPKSWLQGVPSADLPTALDLQDNSADPLTAEQLRTQVWRKFGIRQTGQLDKANDRTVDGYSITSECEKRDAAAAAKITRPWWAIWRRSP